eukprot:5840874-Alexandrium_andersonii.AAC.1
MKPQAGEKGEPIREYGGDPPQQALLMHQKGASPKRQQAKASPARDPSVARLVRVVRQGRRDRATPRRAARGGLRTFIVTIDRVDTAYCLAPEDE